MHVRRVSVPALGLCLVLVPGCEVEPEPDALALTDADRAAIENTRDRWSEYFLAADFDALAGLHHPEAVRMPPDLPPETTPDRIRQGLEPEPGVTVTGFSAESLETEGRLDLAYDRGTYRIEMEAEVGEEEERLTEEGHYLVILRRGDDGEWLIHRHIWNRDHPPAMPEEM